MSNKLKIYACSGIGSADQAQGVLNYWTDNTNTMANTQAVNTLLALINRNYIEVNRLRGMTPEQKIANLNDIDVYTVCLAAAQRYKDDDKGLEHAGVVIGMMMADGDFNYQSLNNSERDAHLDHLIDKANDLFEEPRIDHTNKAFVEWFNQTIVARNHAVKTIGASDDWKQDKDLGEYLLKGSEYFLYLYLTDDQINSLPAKNAKIFRNKKAKQRKTYNYCKSLFIDHYGSEEEMQDIIYSGIVNYFQATPEDVCELIVKGNFNEVLGIGTEPVMIGVLTVAEFITVLTACFTFIGGVIAAICSMVAQTNVAKYAALDNEVVNTSIPTDTDYQGLSGRSSVLSAGTSKWLLLALVGTAAVWFAKKKKLF